MIELFLSVSRRRGIESVNLGSGGGVTRYDGRIKKWMILYLCYKFSKIMEYTAKYKHYNINKCNAIQNIAEKNNF